MHKLNQFSTSVLWNFLFAFDTTRFVYNSLLHNSYMDHLTLALLLFLYTCLVCTSENLDTTAILTSTNLCVRQSECHAGTFCSMTAKGFPQYRCLRPRNVGDVCWPFSLPDGVVCRQGLYCSEKTNKCTVQGSINGSTSSCDLSDQESCVPPALCDKNSRTCRAPREAESGKDCDYDADCGGAQKCVYTRSSRKFQCVVAAVYSVGEICGLTEFDPPCAENTICSSMGAGLFTPSGRCTPRRSKGERCRVTGHCLDGFECVGGYCCHGNVSWQHLELHAGRCATAVTRHVD